MPEVGKLRGWRTLATPPSLTRSCLVVVMRITARESARCSSHAVREMEMVQSLGIGLMGQEPAVIGYSEGWGKPRQLGLWPEAG